MIIAVLGRIIALIICICAVISRIRDRVDSIKLDRQLKSAKRNKNYTTSTYKAPATHQSPKEETKINSIVENNKNYTWLKILFFDTETTWLSDDAQIVQFWWIFWVLNWDHFNEIDRISQYINCSVDIEPSAYQTHHISKSLLRDYHYLNYYIDDIMSYFKRADLIVWHNVEFDIKMMKRECRRLGVNFDWYDVQAFDTMKSTTDLLRIPNPYWYSWYKRPKLSELYYFLFHKDFEDAHDAMADISATKDCFLELVNKWYINTSNFKRRNNIEVFKTQETKPRRIKKEPEDFKYYNKSSRVEEKLDMPKPWARFNNWWAVDTIDNTDTYSLWQKRIQEDHSAYNSASRNWNKEIKKNSEISDMEKNSHGEYYEEPYDYDDYVDLDREIATRESLNTDEYYHWTDYED